MIKLLEVFIAVILTILALPAILLVSMCVGVFVAVGHIVESIDNAFKERLK